MSQPGAGISEEVAERLADTMFALSAPARVLLLGCLLEGPHSVRELTQALGMEQSAVSHQLRVLREHNLVMARQVGRSRLYALYDDHVATLLNAGLDHVTRDHRTPKMGNRQRGAPDEPARGAS